jgi:hypothetical protein
MQHSRFHETWAETTLGKRCDRLIQANGAFLIIF